MKLSFALQRRLLWLNLPGAVLIALLQRTPALRLVASAGQTIVASPVGTLLKSAAAAVASLGAVHSLAGATELSTTHPSPLNVTAGTPIPTVVFDVIGTIGLANSWQIQGDIPPGLNFSGRTSPGVLNISNPTFTGTPTTAGTFNMTLQAWMGAAQTGNASPVFNYTINVAPGGPANVAPSFTTQPTSQNAAVGANVTFTVAVSGTPNPTVQWRKDGANIGGATNTTLTLAGVTVASAGTYTAVATNVAGSVTSSGAVLTVNTTSAPTLATQPVSQTVVEGGTAVFSVEATGTPTPSYQWMKNGGAVAGATTPLLVLRPLSAASIGAYTCVVTNTAGSVTSNAANLNVVATGDPGRLSALSIRGQVGAGSDLMIAGIISSGLTAIIQAVGPTLGVLSPDLANSVLTNPKLELYQLNNGAFNKVAENDDWAVPGAGAAAVTGAAAAAGATQLTNQASKDSALLTTLQPGVYTANVSGINNATGVVLLQAYTVPGPGNGVLSALSIRGRVGTGGDQLIAGIIIAGSTSQTLIIQAVGPTLGVLSPDLVNSVLNNPKLELFQLVNGGFVKVRENDDWGGDAQIIAMENAAGATALSNAASRDSALLVTLAPGIYTANVSGVNNTGGVVLLQAYAVP
ncbi:MAG TPA: immunoglobulin domain-containing protein [Opitutaceae bacterium]|nr:immunoglobulin domain-containing protein [Opitutaceae bacterium]